MEIATRNHLILNQALTTRQKLTLLAVSYAAGPDGICHATNGQLVRMTSTGPRLLQKTLASLVSRGLLERTTTGAGAPTTRTIRIAVEALSQERQNLADLTRPAAAC